MINKISVVIVDDDPRVRQDFRTLLELEPDIVVAGVAGDGRSGVDLISRVTPDVVVMDVRMPLLDGIEATKELRQHGAGYRVLVVTTFDLDEYVLAAVRAGASGFVLKDQAPELLANAVRTVARGDAIVAPRATARLLQEFTRPATHMGTGPLSDREFEIAQLIARGLSNREIASTLVISSATVKTHVSSILTKLDLVSRVQIALWMHERSQRLAFDV